MRKSTRNAIRTIALLTIITAAPLYILGIGLWLFAPDKAVRDRATATVIGGSNNTALPGGFATFTPLGQTGGSGTTPSATLPASPTSLGGIATFPPGSFPTLGAIYTATLPPTRFMTLTNTVAPTATTPPPVVPTNTPQPQPPTTAPIIIPTTEPLLPPTDTPSP